MRLPLGERHAHAWAVLWLPHLAEALQVPAWELERAKMRRRDLLRISGVVAVGAGVAQAIHAAGRDLFDAIAMADAGPLGITQTSHETDLMLAGMSACDRPSMLHLARWADEGVSAVLRVNAVGILAKTPDLDAAGSAVGALRRDPGGTGALSVGRFRPAGQGCAASGG